MAKSETASISSSQPDLRVLAALAKVHRILLTFVTAVSGVCFCGWLIPPLSRLLPHFHFWATMKANNAFVILLCCISLFLSEPRRSDVAVRVSRMLAVVATLFAAVEVYELLAKVTLPIDTLFAMDAYSPHPGRVSLEGCLPLMLVGLVLRNLRVRKQALSHIVDGITLCVILAMLTYTSRYVFGASHIFGDSPTNPMALQTFVCLSVLTWLIVNRRAEYGFFSVLIGSQIGGKTARFAAPFALMLPYLFAVARVVAVRLHLISDTYATAAATTTLSVFAFYLVLSLGRRTNQLENAIRELSLRDDLTNLYNRRGFFLLAEQALLLARRSGEPFFVLFIDVDDLKKTNDTLGHEVGSERLRATGSVIEHTFRETDVIGRIGGDEFVVAGRFDGYGPHGMANPVHWLQEATTQENATYARPFSISFSLGCVVAEGSCTESLEQLLHRADEIMYEAKRAKKRLHADGIPALA